MPLEIAKKAIDEKGFIFDIGQLNKETKRALLKDENIGRCKALWPWIDAGFCKKTIYYKKEN